MGSIYQETDPITHVLFLEFLHLLLATLADRELDYSQTFTPTKCDTDITATQWSKSVPCLCAATTSETAFLNFSSQTRGWLFPPRNGGDGICPFAALYLETTSLQAGPPQRGYLRYPTVGLYPSGQPCIALHTRTQRQTAFGELPFQCGGTEGERPVCLEVCILLAVRPVWLLRVSPWLQMQLIRARKGNYQLTFLIQISVPIHFAVFSLIQQ